MPSTLDEIGLRNGTDKSSRDHGFLSFYELSLQHLRDESFLLIEIGVFQGQSLKTWAEYFPKAVIVGLDVNADALRYDVPANAHVRIGDASKLEFLDEVIAEFGQPRVIIDDGSHFWHHQIDSLRYLWPRLLPGGIYVLEDLHTSFGHFEAEYRNSSYSDITGYDYLMQLNRWVVGNRFIGAERPPDGFIANYWPSVERTQFYRGTSLIHKKPATDTGPAKPKMLLVEPAPRRPAPDVTARMFGGSAGTVKLGIGIVTYNRADCVRQAVERVLQHTKHPFELVVADDGSTDNTAEALAPYLGQLSYMRCENKGVNHNKNRLLYYLNNVARCDVILLIEDDSWPGADGWERKWIEAALKWGHVNNAGTWFSNLFTQGSGTLDDPYHCPDVSAQCAGFSHEAIECVGFIDPAFENHCQAHSEHSYRLARAGYGGEFKVKDKVGLADYYLIDGDIHVTPTVTGYGGGDIAGHQLYFDRRDQSIYRLPWRSDQERESLWLDLGRIQRPPR